MPTRIILILLSIFLLESASFGVDAVENTLITAHVHGGDGRALFDDLFRQAGLPTPAWELTAPLKLDLDVDKQTFWPVVLGLCNREGFDPPDIGWSGMHVKLIYDGGTVGDLCNSGSVTFAIRILPCYRDPAVTRPTFDQPDQSCSLKITPYFDPKFPVIATKPTLIRSVEVDDKPTPLLPQKEIDDAPAETAHSNGPPWRLGATEEWFAIDHQVMPQAQWNARPKGAPYPHHAKITGVGRYLVVTHFTTVTVPDLTKHFGEIFKEDGQQVKVNRIFDRFGDQDAWDVDLDLACTTNDPEAKRLLTSGMVPAVQISAEDAAGNALEESMLYRNPPDPPSGWESVVMSYDRDVKSAKQRPAPPAKLVIRIPTEAKWIDVPFEATNVRCP